MSKEFKIEKATNYFRTYWRAIAIIFPISFAVLARIAMSDLQLRDEFMISVVLLLFLLLFVGILRYFSEKGKIFVISENSLQVVKNNKTKKYDFAKLTKIKRTSEEDIKKTGMDVLELYFTNEKKLKLVSWAPFYHEFRRYLKKTLKDSGYYEKITIVDNDL